MSKELYPKLHVTDWAGDASVPDGCSIGIDDDFGADGGRDYYLFTAVHGDPDQLKDHAERVTHAWNFCRDTPTETLAIVAGDNDKTFGQLAAECARMRAALEWVVRNPGAHPNNVMHVAKEALPDPNRIKQA